ncbi:putative FK506-binding protein 2B [Blattamonas nauphoetae]|uniref:peptidylprolyl isomerase n=1 Tax=Blattamonas nauphoetae TaxID=2049346 RepID=A0ABQ9X3K6_9EUKA|nr:putative FK506-binding protein 2B [Blattamonas nauphoetae]
MLSTLLFYTVYLCIAEDDPAAQAASTFRKKKVPPKAVQAEILKKGDNCTIRVAKGDEVEIGFKLALYSTGKVVDYTEDNEAYSFRVGYGESIEGLDQGMIGMCINETRRLTIPSFLAYGSRGASVIVPPGASIILDVTLYDLMALEFDETRLERVREQKKVKDKRSRDPHYHKGGASSWYSPNVKPTKARDEMEEEERIEAEKRKQQEEEERLKRLEEEEEERVLNLKLTPLQKFQRVQKERDRQTQQKVREMTHPTPHVELTPRGRVYRTLPRISSLTPLHHPRSRGHDDYEQKKNQKKKMEEHKSKVREKKKEKRKQLERQLYGESTPHYVPNPLIKKISQKEEQNTEL